MSANLGGDRLQRHGLRTLLQQELRAAVSAAERLSSGVRRVRLIDTVVSCLSSEHDRNTLLTPTDLSITPRDRRFGRETATPRLWHGGRVEATAIYNALSTTFRRRSLLCRERPRCREGAPKLAEEIKGFTTQEAIHSREHDAFNKRATSSGYDLTMLEQTVERRLAITRARADCQRRCDHGARAFHGDHRARVARQPATPRRGRERNRRPPALARSRGD